MRFNIPKHLKTIEDVVYESEIVVVKSIAP
jgi:hypothetical protein